MAGAARLAAAHAAAARANVSVRVAEYYQTRYRELEAEGLLAAAVAVAPAFQGGADAEATDREVDLALSDSGLGDARARLTLREGLNRLGYIWCPPGQLPPSGGAPASRRGRPTWSTRRGRGRNSGQVRPRRPARGPAP